LYVAQACASKHGQSKALQEAKTLIQRAETKKTHTAAKVYDMSMWAIARYRDAAIAGITLIKLGAQLAFAYNCAIRGVSEINQS